MVEDEGGMRSEGFVVQIGCVVLCGIESVKIM